MSIGAALSISTAEISNLGSQFAVISHNIANANTPDYATEDLQQLSVTVGGVGMGARNGMIQRAVDAQGHDDLLKQNGNVASLTVEQAALQQIDAVSGAVGSGQDLGGLLGSLADAFTTLGESPSSQTQQQQTVAAAQRLAGQLNTLSATVGAQRQAAQDGIVSDVTQINSSLASLGALSAQIVQAKTSGSSTADLQNQRDAVEDTLSKLVSVRFLDQPDGSLRAVTDSGLTLPLSGGPAPFTTSGTTVTPGSSASGGGIPGILLNGQDVTAQMTGGDIGGRIALRDTTLPTIQANLDEFAHTLSTRFDAQGLTLFTDATGTVPTAGGLPAQSGYVGYAGSIQVSPAVLANPSLVRDGTHAVLAGAGAGGATAFTPNGAGGPAGFTDLIGRVVQFALGQQVAAGVSQPAPSVAGLGASGTLSAGFAAPGDLAQFAAAVTGSEAQQSAAVTNSLTSAQSTQTMLQSNLSAATSVSVDAEMSQMIVLQNAYGANAHVLTAVQSMWSQLLQAVQ